MTASSRRRWLPLAGATAALLALTGCSGTEGLPPPATLAPASTTTGSADRAAPDSATPAPADPTDPAATVAPVSAAAITTVPADAADDVSVLTPIVITASAGTLTDAQVANPDGKLVQGLMSADRTRWASIEPLGYGTTYTATATAVDVDGRSTQRTSSFTTLQPAGVIFPSFEPPPDRGQVGVGHPLSVIFDQPPPDRAAAERALSVQTEPTAVAGAWSWVDERTVHYRPREYWPAGTTITLTAAVYGVDLGGGLYGETDRSMTLTVGPAKIATIDDATKQMTVTIDGEVVRTAPVSLGRDESVDVDGKTISFVTPSGIYVAQEKYPLEQMSSATDGLPTDYALGYDSAIPLAVRLSNSGIFVHSAPWSVADQGVGNVSHGCINLPPDVAHWFYDTFSYGDIVQVTGTTEQLAADDGFGDWNVPWEQWIAGSAVT